MTFWAYMLRCSDESFYVGHSDDLTARLAQHLSGEVQGYTSSRRPVTLVWSAEFPSRQEAFAAERQIKGWSRLKKQALIDGDWPALQRLARKSSFDTGFDKLSPTQDERDQAASGNDPVSPTPVIVLVRPQLGENIGKAARAMLNFGLGELRLVSPRDGWPNPAAGPAASGADSVLECAQVFDTVGEAVADCAHVYATTVRRRGVTKPVVTPEQAAAEIRAVPGQSAILFGPERSGLETEDVALARSILTVPINPAFGSLNLAQAVILVAYEWSKAATLAQPTVVEIEPPAPQGELDGMIAQLITMLDAAGFFFPPDRAPTTRRTLRTMLTKPGWSAQEVRTFRGVLTALAKPRDRAS